MELKREMDAVDMGIRTHKENGNVRRKKGRCWAEDQVEINNEAEKWGIGTGGGGRDGD